MNKFQEKLGKLQDNINDNEAYERRDCLSFCGSSIPASISGGICANHVRELISRNLQINLNPVEITISHRLGPKPVNQSVDKRPIIAKLCRWDLRDDILRVGCTRQIQGLYINKSLTPAKINIFNALRQMKKS